MKQIKIEVKEDEDLVNYICHHSDYSKSKIKSLLKYKKIRVNNHKIGKLPLKVIKGDIITIDLEVKEVLPFDILYEDDEILVVNKKAGLLTMANMYDNENTLYRLVREYASKNHFLIFIVHRLDKETSGIVMFAKSERMKMLYQDNWNELVKKRNYLALVEGIVPKDGRIENYLYEESNTFVHSSKIGKKAITNYHIINSNDKYTLLDINIETGRKNQIRVHMSEMGFPIVGDKKYGSKIDPIHRLCLHANVLEVKHPITNEILHFETPNNNLFDKLIKKP